MRVEHGWQEEESGGKEAAHKGMKRPGWERSLFTEINRLLDKVEPPEAKGRKLSAELSPVDLPKFIETQKKLIEDYSNSQQKKCQV